MKGTSIFIKVLQTAVSRPHYFFYFGNTWEKYIYEANDKNSKTGEPNTRLAELKPSYNSGMPGNKTDQLDN